MHDPVERLGEVLEVPECGDGGGVPRERGRVAGMEPESGGVEALAVRLAGAAHAAEVGDEAEPGGRVGSPRGGEERGHRGGRCAWHHVEEESRQGSPHDTRNAKQPPNRWVAKYHKNATAHESPAEKPTRVLAHTVHDAWGHVSKVAQIIRDARRNSMSHIQTQRKTHTGRASERWNSART